MNIEFPTRVGFPANENFPKKMREFRSYFANFYAKLRIFFAKMN